MPIHTQVPWNILLLSKTVDTTGINISWSCCVDMHCRMARLHMTWQASITMTKHRRARSRSCWRPICDEAHVDEWSTQWYGLQRPRWHPMSKGTFIRMKHLHALVSLTSGLSALCSYGTSRDHTFTVWEYSWNTVSCMLVFRFSLKI